jgi:non-ribosomal peptide synthase protein (TIGR01720 family)
VLLEETAAAYAGRPLPPKTRPFLAWPDRLRQHAESIGDARRRHWLDRQGQPALPLPLDLAPPADSNTVASSERVVSTLGPDETEHLLRRTASVLDARMDEMLLATAVTAVLRWTRTGGLVVDLESHGRPSLPGDADFSRTVGWFTSMYPVCLTPASPDLDQVLRSVRETLRGIPDAGVDYGALRYLGDDLDTRARLAAMPRPEIAFNYLGQLDSALVHPFVAVANDSHGDPHDPMEIRSHLIEITGMLQGGDLRLEWNFSRAFHRRETIQDLAGSTMDNLRALIAGSAGASRAPRGAAALGHGRWSKLRRQLQGSENG